MVQLHGSLFVLASLRRCTANAVFRARSTIDAVQDLGHTILLSYQILEAFDLYQAIPKLVRAIIIDPSLITDCLNYGKPQAIPLGQIESGESILATSDQLVEFELDASALKENERWGVKNLMGQHAHNRGGCIRREGFEHGIPLWKMLA